MTNLRCKCAFAGFLHAKFFFANYRTNKYQIQAVVASDQLPYIYTYITYHHTCMHACTNAQRTTQAAPGYWYLIHNITAP